MPVTSANITLLARHYDHGRAYAPTGQLPEGLQRRIE
jgi:hypothetical protein